VTKTGGFFKNEITGSEIKDCSAIWINSSTPSANNAKCRKINS
jgi:hypothetical protein